MLTMLESFGMAGRHYGSTQQTVHMLHVCYVSPKLYECLAKIKRALDTFTCLCVKGIPLLQCYEMSVPPPSCFPQLASRRSALVFLLWHLQLLSFQTIVP